MKKTNTTLIPQPLCDKILISPIDEATRTGGKAYIPETETKEERKKSSQGKVIAIGGEYKGELKKGDLCYFDKFSGEYFTIGGHEYYAIRPDDIYVVLR